MTIAETALTLGISRQRVQQLIYMACYRRAGTARRGISNWPTASGLRIHGGQNETCDDRHPIHPSFTSYFLLRSQVNIRDHF